MTQLLVNTQHTPKQRKTSVVTKLSLARDNPEQKYLAITARCFLIIITHLICFVSCNLCLDKVKLFSTPL